MDQAKADFFNWWDGDDSDDKYLRLEPDEADKLRDAFEQVFYAMPEADRKAFLEESPRIVCSSDYGMALFFQITHAAMSDKFDLFFPVTAIYLRHDLVHLDHCVDTVAHEMAHIVRGDHKKTDQPHEKEADDLSESWGFKRCYSKDDLEPLERR